jgi:hypothetical protein
MAKVWISRWPPGGHKIGQITKIKKSSGRIAQRYCHTKFHWNSSSMGLLMKMNYVLLIQILPIKCARTVYLWYSVVLGHLDLKDHGLSTWALPGEVRGTRTPPFWNKPLKLTVKICYTESKMGILATTPLEYTWKRHSLIEGGPSLKKNPPGAYILVEWLGKSRPKYLQPLTVINVMKGKSCQKWCENKKHL